MKRFAAFLLGLKIGLLLLSFYWGETETVVADEFVRNGEIVQIATTSPEVVLIDTPWTKERIIEEIEKTFPEAPATAVAIAKCESGLVPDIQSRHILSYGQERSFGLMQIHAPDWHEKALELGYDKYQTDVRDNLAMARYIYEQAGDFSPWTCSRMI